MLVNNSDRVTIQAEHLDKQTNIHLFLYFPPASTLISAAAQCGQFPDFCACALEGTGAAAAAPLQPATRLHWPWAQKLKNLRFAGCEHGTFYCFRVELSIVTLVS